MRQLVITLIFLFSMIISSAGVILNQHSSTPDESEYVAGHDSLVNEGKFGPLNTVCSGVNIHFTKGHEKDLDMCNSYNFYAPGLQPGGKIS